jgi:hypothetical protein
MKKFFVPVVAVVLFGTVSASAQSASQPAKPQPKTTTAAAQKAPAATAKTTTAPATKPANAIASTAPKGNSSAAAKSTDTGKPKKTHRLHKKAESQTNASANGAAGGTAKKSKASKQ